MISKIKLRPYLALLPLFSLILAGCQHRWDPDPEFGVAVRNLAAAQYVNPDAPRGNGPLPGLDGPAAQSTIKTYQKSFETPKTQSLSTGGGASGGGGSGAGGGATGASAGGTGR